MWGDDPKRTPPNQRPQPSDPYQFVLGEAVQVFVDTFISGLEADFDTRSRAKGDCYALSYFSFLRVIDSRADARPFRWRGQYVCQFR